MTPYVLKGKLEFGKWHGELLYGNEVVTVTEDGLKSEKALQDWAHDAASAHKWSNAPEQVHTIEKRFVL